jgi:hypothetical protein
MMSAKAHRMRAPSDAFLSDARTATLVKDKLRFVLEYGVLAPGGHPWMITVAANAIELRLGHRCQKHPHDGEHREALIGCGIGLAQLRLALRQLGAVESIILLPEESQPDLLARIYIDRLEEADPESYVLYQALYAPVSRTPRGMDRSFQQELAANAGFERASIVFTAHETLPPSGTAPTCGAPSLEGLVTKQTWMDPRAVSPSGLRTAAETARLTDPVGAVIATGGDAVSDWLAAGQALARVALRARVEGFYTIATAAPRGARAPNGLHAHVAVRFGVPESSPVADVLPPEASGIRRSPR